MNDLIERARKYALSAGRIGQSQYLASEKTGGLAIWLTISSTGLSAIVGTALFAQLASGSSHAWVSVVLGIVTFGAAALSAIAQSAKYGEGRPRAS